MNLFETAFAYVQHALRRDQHEADADAAPQEPASTVLLLDPEEAPATEQEPVAEPAAELSDEFADLLSGIGAVSTPAEEVTALDRKDREIAELQRNLQMLRPIGDELARVEQLRIAELASFESELSDLRAELQDTRTSEASAEPSATPGASAQGLRDVSRLIAALDSTLTGAHTTPEANSPTPKAEERLTRARTQLASARKRLTEQKRKTAQRRTEAQELRGQVKTLERQQRALLAERRKFYAPVRELARRAKRRSPPLSRLIELLGLELDRP